MMTVRLETADLVGRQVTLRERDRYHVRQDRIGPYRIIDGATEDTIYTAHDRLDALIVCRVFNRAAGGADRCLLDGRCEICAGAGTIDAGAYDRFGDWTPDRRDCAACRGTGRKLFQTTPIRHEAAASS